MTIHLALSGGLDSTTALAAAHTQGNLIKAWGFDYGQRHLRELTAAQQVAAHYGVPYRTLNLNGLLGGSALLNDTPLPEGHYTAETMKATVVNGRNLLFASTLVSFCEPGDAVWFGVHAGDHAIYPDCRSTFWEPFAEAVAAAYEVDVVTPYIGWSKAAICAEGHRLSAPLDRSWSCYAGGENHCGRCGTCVERAEAFHLAQVPDPTSYADPEFWRTQCAS